MLKKNYPALANIDKSLLTIFSNEQLLDSLCIENSETFDKIYFHLKNNPKNDDNKHKVNSISYTILEEINHRFTQKLVTLETIISHTNVTSLSFLSSVIQEGLNENPEKLHLVLKKIAHLKNSHSLHSLIENTLSLPYYAPQNITESSLKSIHKCFKTVESKGSNTAISLMYLYIKKLDIRNILLSNLNVDAKIGTPAYEKTALKLSVIRDILINETEFKIDNSKLLEPQLTSISNIKEFYYNILSTYFTDSNLSNPYATINFFCTTYKNNPESHDALNQSIYNAIDNKKFINIKTLAYALEYSPITENKIFSHIIENNVLIGENEHETFKKIHILTRDCPRLISKIPEKYTKNIEYAMKLIFENTNLVKFWDYSNANESFLFFNNALLDSLNIEAFSRNNKFEFVQKFLSYFPFENLDVTPHIKTSIKNLFLKILQNDSASQGIQSLSLSMKEYLIEENILSYQQLFSMEEKYSFQQSQKTTLSNFDYQTTEKENPLMSSFLKFLKTSQPTEILNQFTPQNNMSYKIPFKIGMQILLHVNEDELFTFLCKLQEQTEYNYGKPIVNNIDELFNICTENVKRFYYQNFSKGNSYNLSPSAFLEQCYMVVNQEKMNREIPIYSEVSSGSAIKMKKF